MINKSSNSQKNKQISLTEYSKIKEKISRSKLKLIFPRIIILLFVLPLGYYLFLVIYYVAHLRFLPEH